MTFLGLLELDDEDNDLVNDNFNIVNDTYDSEEEVKKPFWASNERTAIGNPWDQFESKSVKSNEMYSSFL